MKKLIALVSLLAAVFAAGCSGGDFQLNTDELAGCLGECVTGGKVWVVVDGDSIQVDLSKYSEVIFK